MAIVHKSATRVGLIRFENGNQVELHLGYNANTGEAILWQSLNGSRPRRATGRNLVSMLDELNHVLCEGIGQWVDRPSEELFDRLQELAQ